MSPSRARRKSGPKENGQTSLFSSLFEENFFERTLGDLVRVPDVALGELVANAWDAGASRVEITIPSNVDEKLAVVDDGCGLTKEQFHDRWMCLAYNRQRHQGSSAQFPPERADWPRRAYGRNGQGRHGLLCFGDSYRVETWRDGTLCRFDVRCTGGEQPFVAQPLAEQRKSGHGTALTVVVKRRRPDPDRIREILASRFLHDPNFHIVVNGTSLPFEQLPGLSEQRTLQVKDPASDRIAILHLSTIDGDAGRTKHQSGVAFWVGGRLVGEPGWIVDGTPILDGRTRAGRRLTFVVKTDDLFDEVLPDWTGFRRTGLVAAVAAETRAAVVDILRALYSKHVQETTAETLDDFKDALLGLEPGDQVEVVEVAESITTVDPLVSKDVLSAAVAGAIEAKKRNAPQALIERIMALPDEDIEGLHRLLDEWNVRDALSVLDEIGRRIKVVEVLEKLMGEPDADEVHVLHPLVTQARWLFGPEYDSPQYVSNVSLLTAAKKIFGANVRPEDFLNPRKRPDLVLLPTETFSLVGTEDFDPETGLARFRRLLLVELKRGGFRVGRKEMDQASGYVEDLLNTSEVEGRPYIHAFVVAHEVDERTTAIRRIGDPEHGRVEATTFSRLVRTANARLFHLRGQIRERYPETGKALLDRILKEPKQVDLFGLLKASAAS